ncbi:MAG: Flp family type IVb pilin [Deltaproteobacteria bacterium]|nr:Flp family type IVb pilin [Deltaproteobacteria bacterium]
MLPLPRSWLSSRRAATSIEYALIASLVSVFIIGAVAALGQAVGNQYDGTFARVVHAINSVLGTG